MQTADQQAIDRYRYMLKTAPPETIEQAHAEAFAQLKPEQRRQLLQTMGEHVPPAERAMAEQGAATPQALARMATRAEIRQPGSLGSAMAGSLLGSVAGAVIGSMIARQFFSDQGAAEPSPDTELGGADQTFAEGESPDLGSFDV
jgi:hypothetical protein